MQELFISWGINDHKSAAEHFFLDSDINHDGKISFDEFVLKM